MTVDVVIPYDDSYTPKQMLERAISAVKSQTVETNIIVSEVDGVSEARNDGLSRSVHDYVAFLDADDYWEPEKLEVQVNLMQDTDATACINSTIRGGTLNDLSFTSRSRLIERIFLGQISSFTSGLVVDTSQTDARFRSLPRREDHLFLIETAENPVCVENPYTYVEKHDGGLSSVASVETRKSADQQFYRYSVQAEPQLRSLSDEFWAECHHRYGRKAYRARSYEDSMRHFRYSLSKKVRAKTVGAAGVCLFEWAVHNISPKSVRR